MPAPAVQPVDVALRDGSTVRVRPVSAADVGGIRDLLGGLSDRSRWLRFMTAATDLQRAAEAAAQPVDGAGLVVTAGSPERIVAHATYMRERPERAEVAFEVADEWHGRGIATILLAHLVGLAERDGIATFVAYVHPSNHRMIGVFRDSGFAVEVNVGADELIVELPAALGEAARRRFEDRGRAAAVAAVAHVLRPASIAVVDASDEQPSLANAVLRNLVGSGYAGAVYAVHPDGEHRTVDALPEAPALALLAGPPDEILRQARACGAAGVRALAVLSGGFADAGKHGRERLADLLATCRASGMRLVGPNSLGVLNTHLQLNATVTPAAPAAGRIALASQSGAIGVAAIAEAQRRGLGLSTFVSTGDKADLSGNDFLQYWEQDDETAVVLLYLESFGNPHRFGRIARRIAATKPIVAVKGGRTAAAPRASSTGIGALLSASDVSVDALFEHAGVIRTDTVSEQLDVAALLASQPLPKGESVAIVSNARGPALACADAATAAGLEIGTIVDLGASATAERFAHEIEPAAAAADAVIAIAVPSLATQPHDVTAALQRTDLNKPLLVVVLAADAPTADLPLYSAPEEAARALARAARYARRRSEPADEPPDPESFDGDAAAAVLARALGRGGGWLRATEVDAVLAAYGVPTAEARVAATAEEAAAAAAELGGPVAVKATAPGIAHRSDVGGVRLGVEGPAAPERAARDAAAAIRRAGADPQGFVVQRMVPAGVELAVGVLGDPSFGPIVACGAAGPALELLGDVSVRPAPLGRRAAAEMLRSLRSFPLLDGYRGRPRADVAAVEDVLVRIAALGAAHPQIAELDCDPVLAATSGATVVDARVRVEPVAARRPFPALDR